MRRRASLLLLPLLVLAFLVGCSDDDSSDEADDTTTTAADEPASGDESTDSTEATDSTDTSEATDPGEDGGGEDTTTTIDPAGGDEEEFCAAYTQFEEDSSSLPDETIDDLREGTATLRDLLATAGEAAPDALQEDFDALDGALADLQDIVDDSETVAEAEEAAGSIFSDEAFTESGGRIDAYASQVC